MLTLHHLNNSRSQRILWLLEELGLPYEIKRYERNARTMLAPPELKAVHPLGKSPLLSDDGLVIAESGAIIEYLLERYGNGQFLPAAGTPEQRAFYEGLLLRVREAPAWREALDRGMLESAAAPDAAAYARWLAAEELRHEEWLYAGGVFARR